MAIANVDGTCGSRSSRSVKIAPTDPNAQTERAQGGPPGQRALMPVDEDKDG
jgi:hypothetical protein